MAENKKRVPAGVRVWLIVIGTLTVGVPIAWGVEVASLQTLPAHAATQPPTDIPNVQRVKVDGQDVRIFDVDHNGTNLICTLGPGGSGASCIKR